MCFLAAFWLKQSPTKQKAVYDNDAASMVEALSSIYWLWVNGFTLLKLKLVNLLVIIPAFISAPRLSYSKMLIQFIS